MKPGLASRGRLAALAVVFAYAAWFHSLHTWDILEALFRPETVARWPFEIARSEARITRIARPELAPGLATGDLIRDVEGGAVRGLADLYQPLTQRSPGQQVRITVERDGSRLGQQVTLVPEGTRAATRFTQVLLAAVFLMTTWLSVLLGSFVVFRRPGDRLAWLLLALLLGFAQALSSADALAQYHSRLVAVSILIFGRLAGSLWPAWMLWFGLDFPDPNSPRKFLPFLRWPLTIPLLLIAAVRVAAGIGANVDLAASAPVVRLATDLAPVWFWLSLFPIGLFFANLGYKVGLEQAPDARRKLRLLLWGAAVSLTPTFLLLIAAFVWKQGDFTQFASWIWIPPLVLLMLFPATLAYVIVVWRALDVGVVVRQGLQYAMATKGLALLRLALIGAAILLALDLGKMSGMHAVNRWIAICGLVTAVLLSRFGIAWLKAWTDRRFFRERVNVEHVLADLGDEIRNVAEVEPLLKTVAQRVCDSLHVSKMAVLLRRDGVYHTEFAAGYPAALEACLPASGAAVVRLQTTAQALRLYWDDPESWVHKDLQATPDYEQLRALDCQLLLPVRARSELLGLICLGPKLSEEAYSTSDIRLLQSVATQTAFALENSRLASAVAHEAAQRERFARELEIAKEVQEQLLPKQPAPVPGLDYAGVCQPAQSVGGDYFDYFLDGAGALYFAVGDVAGKGIPAALLMASVQSSLRGLLHGGIEDLGEAMKRLNRLIHMATPKNRFATLFLGRYWPETRHIEYACAGHNPPLLLKADGTAEWLTVRGPALGMTHRSSYTPGELILHPGDVLAIYSDGISEAMNPENEEFGEQRLAAATANALPRLPAQEALQAILAEVRRHTAAAPQHDDMTLLILRAVKR